MVAARVWFPIGLSHAVGRVYGPGLVSFLIPSGLDPNVPLSVTVIVLESGAVAVTVSVQGVPAEASLIFTWTISLWVCWIVVGLLKIVAVGPILSTRYDPLADCELLVMVLGVDGCGDEESSPVHLVEPD